MIHCSAVRIAGLAQALFLALPLLGATCAEAGAPSGTPITLELDLRDAPRQRFLVHEVIPVSAGHLRLVYPKWIPGEHGPTGPINGLTGLSFTAGGQSLSWRRDLAEMYAIELEVPAGVTEIDARFQYLPAGDGQFGAGGSTTPVLAEMEWNQVLLYPEGAAASAIPFQASVQVPKGWTFATALEISERGEDSARFQPTSLETLVDSPLFAGAYARSYELSPGVSPPVRLNVFGDRADQVELSPEQLKHARALASQAIKLTGAAHYRHYDFLFGVSDYTASFGLEHHESSDDRLPADYYTDPDNYLAGGGLLPHEYFHSWNGKFRRPAGLATPDYQQPMKGELLWVYEGLTNYFGEVLAARAGVWNAEQYRDYVAMTAAQMQSTTGRRWRPLQDTADAAQLLYGAPRAYTNWRRSVDYYPEGTLLWLDVDTEIRTLSKGRKSLDDFVQAFYGKHPGAVEVLPYDFDEVVATLQSVVAADWRGKLQTLLTTRRAEAPLEGVKRAGWTLGFSDTPTALFKSYEKVNKRLNQTSDIGLVIDNDPAGAKGTVIDVTWEGPAFAAGVAPGMKIVAVNDEDFSAESLRRAIKAAAKASAPIRLLVHAAGGFQTIAVDWHGGERYPRLEPIKGQDDLLARIAAPRS